MNGLGVDKTSFFILFYSIFLETKYFLKPAHISVTYTRILTQTHTHTLVYIYIFISYHIQIINKPDNALIMRQIELFVYPTSWVIYFYPCALDGRIKHVLLFNIC